MDLYEADEILRYAHCKDSTADPATVMEAFLARYAHVIVGSRLYGYDWVKMVRDLLSEHHELKIAHGALVKLIEKPEE
jgi:hypothetical protein